MANVNLGALAASTFDKMANSGEFADNVFAKTVVLDHLKKNDGVVEETGGGDKIRVELMYGKNTTSMPFTKGTVLDVSQQEGLDAARYDIAFYNTQVSFDYTEKVRNRGKEAIAKLIVGKLKQAQLSAADLLNTDIFTGAGPSSLRIVGLQTMASATGVVGEIDGAANTFWQGYNNSTGAVIAFDQLRVMKNTTGNGVGGSKTSLLVGTQLLYEKLMSLATVNSQMNPVAEGKRLAEMGFENLQFEGVPVTYDEACPVGEFYGISKDSYKLRTLVNFDRIDKEAPYNQHLEGFAIVWAGAATTDRRKSVGRVSNKTNV